MRSLRTLAAGTLAVSAALVALAAPASAHVSVGAAGATRGGVDQVITFRVPVEKDVDTVKVAISLPTDTPIVSVDVAPLAGWTHAEKTVHLTTPIKTDDGEITDAVSEIVWTAQPGHGFAPGEFGQFTIIAGLLPDVPTLTFGAVQTYRDGSVVKWIESPAPGSTAEPEFPAPTLTLAAATDAPSTAATSQPVLIARTPPAGKADTSGASTLAVIALVIAAAAMGHSVLTRVRARR